MKFNRILSLTLAVLFLASLAGFAETKKIDTMGKYTFARVRGNVPTEGVMKMLVDRYAADIQKGFEMAGFADLYQPFMNQVAAAAFTDMSIDPNAAPADKTFMWMMFRSQGKVKVVKDLEWAGLNPLPVYAFKVTKDFKNYWFIIPKPCGNIALLKIEEALPMPECDLKVTPAKANVNEPFTIDMSGSKFADAMEVTFLDAAGATVATKALTAAAPVWQMSFDKPGDYLLKAKASNARGEVTGPGCEARVHVNFPPVCVLSISCTTCKDFVGKPIIFDASGSNDPDGSIVKASFEVTDEAGQVVDAFMKSESPFLWEKVFDKPGNYVVTVTVFDDMGISHGGAEPCRIPFLVTQKKLFPIVEFGSLLARGTYTGFIFARAGILYKISPDVLDFILTAGGAIPTRGEPWTAFIMGNALLSVHAGPAFFGGGLGFSTKEQTTRKAGLDLVGQVGVDVLKTPVVGGIFAELRAPVLTPDRSFDEHHKLLLGFRLLF
ncbi:MAG: hypothetical protein A2Y56_12295 [Candidatus Aminicenantes bacterium RBG_13_63_10]|nr:MAG: hypothetical protein A2Y56_12295 [Candidatus Aminicenantes bacterium RBG_13_63_10]